MTHPYPPPQPDGINPDSNVMPSPLRAARRVLAYLESFGDGVIDAGDPGDGRLRPLHARDLQSLAVAARKHERQIDIKDTTIRTLQRERVDALQQVELLRYERRLLWVARMTMDLIAAGTPDRWEQMRAEAEDVAQRIVDEIGHPTTDEPALGPCYRAQLADAREKIRELTELLRATRPDATEVDGLPAADETPDGGPWTSHGHPIPGITVAGSKRPPTIGRCGGPALCKACRDDEQRIRAEADRG